MGRYRLGMLSAACAMAAVMACGAPAAALAIVGDAGSAVAETDGRAVAWSWDADVLTVSGDFAWEDLKAELAGHPGVTAVVFAGTPAASGDAQGAFKGMRHLASVTGAVDASGTTSMAELFDGCEALTALDLSGWDTTGVADMSFMLRGCTALAELDVSGLDTAAVNDMTSMFAACPSLKELDLSGFDTGAVARMDAMFTGDTGLKRLDLSGFDTADVVGMSMMFYRCSALMELDVSGWDTSSVTSMVSMFEGCGSLTELDLSDFDTANVRSMASMFAGCTDLETLDISGFETPKVTNLSCMFYDCMNLAAVDVSGFETGKVDNFYRMFDGCGALETLDLSSFTTSGALDVTGMFQNCENLAYLDASGFDLRSVAADAYMLGGCESLETLVLGANWRFDEAMGFAAEGVWMSPDADDEGAYTAAELETAWDGAAMAGTWTRALRADEGRITYDDNTGEWLSETRVVRVSDLAGYHLEYPSAWMEGYEFAGWSTTADGTGGLWAAGDVFTGAFANHAVTLYAQWLPAVAGAHAMWRLYNPNSGEHFYTASTAERANLVAAGWRYEGIGWYAPDTSATPVYRLYSGTDHHYTTSEAEKDALVAAGWKYEGIGWYSAAAGGGVALYRQFNPNVDPTAARNNSGSHNYTTSLAENNNLVKAGWREEGIGWYGVKTS